MKITRTKTRIIITRITTRTIKTITTTRTITRIIMETPVEAVGVVTQAVQVKAEVVD